METIAFCEIDQFCYQILKKHWPTIPIFKDIRRLSADDLPIRPDLLCGGYPCQPFSVAGKQRGAKDDRHLWPEMFRLLQEIRPRWVICENVYGHVSMGLDAVLSDMESEGYTAQTFIVPACAINAPHRRDRVWIIANKDSELLRGEQEPPKRQKPPQPGDNGQEWNVPHTDSYSQPVFTLDGEPWFNVADTNSQPRGEKRNFTTEPDKQGQFSGGAFEEWRGGWWSVEPPMDRVADGIPYKVDRLKGLGNAVVPQIPELIGRCIIEIEKQCR